MKNFKKYFLILFMGICCFLFGCTYSSNTPLELSFNEIYVQVNEIVKLEVSSTNNSRIVFSSEDESVAKVTQDGLITGISEGTTRIKVSQGKYDESCIVHVGTQEPTKIYIFSNDNLNLTYGDNEIIFTAIFDKIVSSNVNCQWYLNETLVFENSNQFEVLPNFVGDFELYAKYKEVKSNILHFSIKKAPLEVIAEDKNADYLASEVALTYKIINGALCYNDAFAGDLSREQGLDAGKYNIEQGTLGIINEFGDSVIANYDFIFTKGIYTINKIPQKEISLNDINANITSTVLHLESEIDNLEFSLDNQTWQDSNVFENLNPNTDYTVYIRIKETINHISSGTLELKVHTLKQYKINMYAINGNPNNEEYELFDSLTYDEGSNIELVLYHPDVNGYTFNNYRYILNNEDIIDQSEIHIDSISQDINVYANYSINIYNIKFVSYDKEVEYSFKYMDQISLPEAGEKLGYIFTNWIDENDNIIDESLLVSQNLILIAQYEVKNFVVAFYNSSQIVHSEVVAAYDKLTFIPENPSQIGYDFIGWNTKLDGSGTYYYTLSDLTKIKEDLYLFAVYKIHQYKITYLDYDGSLLYEEMVDYGNRALYDDIPKREGYIFIGWSISLDKVTQDLIVTAQYQEI